MRGIQPEKAVHDYSASLGPAQIQGRGHSPHCRSVIQWDGSSAQLPGRVSRLSLVLSFVGGFLAGGTMAGGASVIGGHYHSNTDVSADTELTINGPPDYARMLARMATGGQGRVSSEFDALPSTEEVMANLTKEDAEAVTQSIIDDTVRAMRRNAESGNLSVENAPGTGYNGDAEKLNVLTEEQLKSIVTSAEISQREGGYQKDFFNGVILSRGTRVYGGLPGQTSWYTNFASLRNCNFSRSKLFQGLQVKPHPILGYRTQIGSYELMEDVLVAEGKAIENIQNGFGGYHQYYIKDVSNLKLVDIVDLVD